MNGSSPVSLLQRGWLSRGPPFSLDFHGTLPCASLAAALIILVLGYIGQERVSTLLRCVQVEFGSHLTNVLSGSKFKMESWVK